MKEYELPPGDYNPEYYTAWHAAQKKLLEWLVENDLLSHLPFTGATPTKPCEMCQLLKDFGIN